MGNYCSMGIEFQLYEIFFCIYMEMNGGYGSTALQTYLIALNCTLKMAKVVNFMSCVFYHSKKNLRTSLVVQWLRICLPMQGAWVRSLVQKDPTCCEATKPVHHNYWACALEPVSHNYWARMPQLLKLTCPRAHAPQLLSPCTATTEACTLYGPHATTTEPACCNYWSPHTPRACALQQKKPPQ